MLKRSRRVQLLLFVVISYLILWILFGAGKLFRIPFSYNPRELGGILVLIGVPASLIGAVIAVLVMEERKEIRLLFSHSFQWHLSSIWYIAAILTPLVITSLGVVGFILTAKTKMPEHWFTPSMPIGFMLFFLVYDGLGEEIGWRGFALPKFQQMLGSLGGSIAVGILWALWHLPLFLMPGSFQYGETLIPYIYLLTCWTIVMSLFISRAQGSILPGILLHETANFVAFSINCPKRGLFLLWGIAALAASLFLPKPLIKFGNSSK